jgi:HlyD family secretion protein
MRTRLRLAGVAAGAAALVVWYVAHPSGGTNPELLVRVERGRLRRSVVASGVIEPRTKVEVKSKANGIIERLYVDVGDRVEQGALLAQLDRRTLEARLRETNGALAAAEADLVAARAVLMRARAEAASVDAEFTRRRYERLRRLAEDGLVAPDDLEQAERVAREAQRLQDVRVAELRVAEAAVQQAQAQVEQARAVRERAEEELSNASLRSPVAGVVLSRHVEVGTAVSSILNQGAAATLLLVLGAADQAYFEGTVDEADVLSVKPGAPARVTTTGLGARVLDGHVTRVAPMGDRAGGTSRFGIRVAVPDAAALLRPNMSANAEIVLEERSDCLFLPEAAVGHESAQRAFVELFDPGSPGGRRKVAVQLGISDGLRVEVLAPLKEGDRVHRR